MSSIYRTKCNSCGYKFQLNIGHGFYFTMYRCEGCGGEKRIDHLGVRAFNVILTPGQIGKCEDCGGELSENAKPKCPKCKSDDLTKDQNNIISFD
ncbi:MAG: hypothetical protein ABH832_03055 [bacterium]